VADAADSTAAKANNRRLIMACSECVRMNPGVWAGKRTAGAGVAAARRVLKMSGRDSRIAQAQS
jgi:hypothetical protein